MSSGDHKNEDSNYTSFVKPLPRRGIHWRKANYQYTINNNKTSRKRLNFTDNEDDHDNGHDAVTSVSKYSFSYTRNYSGSFDDIDGLLSNRKSLNTRTGNSNRDLLNRNETRKNFFHKMEWNYFKAGLTIILFILAGVYISGVILESKSMNISYDKVTYRNDLANIGVKYNVNGEIISGIQLFVYMISQKEDADSFIFIYNSNLADFSASTFEDFVDNVASSTAKFLRNNDSVHPVAVDSTSLSLQDSTELIDAYKENVTKNAVLLLKNIHKLPSSFAMALHYYCDEYNPVVKKSAIFLTFDLANCVEQTFSHLGIENCLAHKWNEVPQSKIRPLLTRVVSIVIDLTDVFIIKNE